MTLDILRGFQGIGAAATIPASLGILAHAFPPSRTRNVAFSTFAAGAPLGAALGMALGGVLTQETVMSWRSPFYLETGLTFLCLIGGLISFDPDQPSTEPDKRVDWIGAFLVTAGLVLIVFVLGQGEIAPEGWKTPYIIALLITGVLLVILFLLWQSHLEQLQDHSLFSNLDDEPKGYHSNREADKPAGTSARSWLTPPPLMKVSLWRRAKGRFAIMMAIAFLTWCSFLSWNFWAQLYYQDYMGYSPVQTVLRLLPMFVSGVICNILVAAVVDYAPVLYLIVIGTAGTSLASLLFAVINPNTVYWAFGFPGAVVAVIGADFVFASGTLFIAKVAEPHEQSLAGALFQTMTQVSRLSPPSHGGSTGVALLNVVTRQQAATGWGSETLPPLESYQAAQWGAFAFGVLATLLAIIFFRGVGVVGERKVTAYDDDSKQEKSTTVSSPDLEDSKQISN
ncbi:hypothetical protein H0H81_006540 [Sphagnurus paluster]|uniref:Major facilitator superfamily (MFS) profile domain-containing protein n=1 Tax=Sphagnurus paluster TaxID=117069 RepID=A0A9P7FRK7_9AGAR|nr:hypothetical protein H0H81_006540 [Sphagnurus paluster]